MFSLYPIEIWTLLSKMGFTALSKWIVLSKTILVSLRHFFKTNTSDK